MVFFISNKTKNRKKKQIKYAEVCDTKKHFRIIYVKNFIATKLTEKHTICRFALLIKPLFIAFCTFIHCVLFLRPT